MLIYSRQPTQRPRRPTSVFMYLYLKLGSTRAAAHKSFTIKSNRPVESFHRRIAIQNDYEVINGRSEIMLRRRPDTEESYLWLS